MTLRETFEQAWTEVTGRAKCVVQDKEELFGFIQLLVAQNVRSYLELGTSEGVSLYCVGRCLPQESIIYGVDLGEEHSVGHLSQNITLLRQAGQFACFIKSTCADARDQFTDGMFDAVFIDADHTYESVKQDWEMYRNVGRIVAFHDIRLEGPGRLWREIGGGLELHHTACTQKWGIGVRS